MRLGAIDNADDIRTLLDIARIEPDFRRTALNRLDRPGGRKMNIGDQRHVHFLNDLRKSSRVSLSRHGNSHKPAPGGSQPPHLTNTPCDIGRIDLGHRLNHNFVSPANTYRSNTNNPCFSS